MKNDRMESKFVKYSTYEICEMINKEIQKYGSKEELVSRLNLDVELLDDILKDCSIFTVAMYDMASAILRIPYNELTRVETIQIEKKFRKLKKEDTKELHRELEFVDQLFNFIIYNDKINKKL